MIYSPQKSKVKAKKKPGWKKEEEEYKAWLSKWQKPSDKKKITASKLEYSLSQGTRPTRIIQSKTTPLVQEKVLAPQVQYKENPEMLERELKARERKFTTAPIYNKGGNVLVTDEMMKDITAGTTRRR